MPIKGAMNQKSCKATGPVVIIGCGAKKRRGAWPAFQLYTGGYFLLNLRWALSVADRADVFILSAKYGLLGLRDVVPSYDLRMGDPGSISARVVAAQAKTRDLIRRRVYVSAGSDYVELISAAIPGAIDLGSLMKTPNLKIGYRRQWLSRNCGVLPPNERKA